MKAARTLFPLPNLAWSSFLGTGLGARREMCSDGMIKTTYGTLITHMKCMEVCLGRRSNCDSWLGEIKTYQGSKVVQA